MNQYIFWISDNQLKDVVIFLNEIMQSDTYFDLENIKYELFQTDTVREIYFNLYTTSNIVINIARDSDDREIILWYIDYYDEITEKITELKVFLSSFENKF
ncbi:hypothetical protein SAMN05421857_3116 [Chryseobacterium formosense]|nr:hypothetical protein [Chryseobacterium formosense]SFT76106.1 hypothetical protein SAMN05421857_3116 [Chryseobacterium formosense]